MRTFEISDLSMAPSLLPGDYVAASRLRRPRRGDVVVFERRPGFWMVKRVAAMEGETAPTGPVPVGSVWVLSDNRTATRADSRTFGPVPLAGMYRVVFRYHPLSRAGRVVRRQLPS